MNFAFKAVVSAVLMAVTLITGFILGRKGVPYPTAIFTVHKLAAIAGAVLLIVTAVRILSAADFPSGATTAAVIFAVSVIVLVASGALMSIKPAAGNLPVLLHRIAAAFSVCSACITVLL